MNDVLHDLARLDPNALHRRAAEANGRYATAAWELAACLLAMERSAAFREFHCANAVEYAEQRLGIGAVKAMRLLAVARVLERFPLLSAACRDGKLCWSKLREISRAVDAQTEKAWLEFALSHSTREVERAVALSPRQFHREQAAREAGEEPRPAECAGAAGSASASGSATTAGSGTPSAGAADATLCKSSSHSADGSDAEARCGAGPGTGSSSSPKPEPPSAPVPPRLVKVELWMTSDQFAIWDEALEQVRSQRKGRVSREAALESMARHYLATGSARARVNHPAVVRVDSSNGVAYYETSRGVLPASAEAVEDALARERGTFVAAREGELPSVVEQPPVVGQATSVEQPGAIVEEQSEAKEQHRNAEEAAEAREHQCPAEPGLSNAATMGAPSPSTLPRGKGKPHPRKAVSLTLRRQALARANHRCQRCGGTRGLEVDHVAPVCDGGPDWSNLQVLCHTCHGHKHAEDFASDPRYIRGRAIGVARRGKRGKGAA